MGYLTIVYYKYILLKYDMIKGHWRRFPTQPVHFSIQISYIKRRVPYLIVNTSMCCVRLTHLRRRQNAFTQSV